MLRRIAVGVAAVGFATLGVPIGIASAELSTVTAAADDPVTTCRKALEHQPEPARRGVCFWAGEEFTGHLDVHPNPAEVGVCGNIASARSVVNLTNSDRLLYSGNDCHETNFVDSVRAGSALGEIGTEDSAESWR